MLPSLSLLWAMVPFLAVSISPNQQMMLGGGIIAAGVALSSQAVRDKIKAAWAAIPFPGKGASAADSISSVTTCQQAHLAVSALMTYFSQKGDSKGALLATSIGQHLYTQQLDAIKPVNAAGTTREDMIERGEALIKESQSYPRRGDVPAERK